MKQVKSSITKTILDILRNLLIVVVTLYVTNVLWQMNWLYGIIGLIPIYIVFLNIFGFITLPLYFLTPESKQVRSSNKLFSEFGLDIESEVLSLIEEGGKREIQRFSPNAFSVENFEKAKNIIENLTQNNKMFSSSFYKSYHSLKYSKESNEIAFNYLLDSIKFDVDSPIYGNHSFADNLRERHMKMLLTYVSDKIDQFPKNLDDKIFHTAPQKINLAANQISITELINWRNEEQWNYFLDNFGVESDLGKVCLKKIKERNYQVRG